MWQLIHTFLKNPIQDEMNQKERCSQMIYAVNELINLRGLVSKAAVQQNKMTESSKKKKKTLAIQTDIQACSKWPFEFFCFFLVDLNTVKYVHRSDTVHTLYTYIKYVYILYL